MSAVQEQVSLFLNAIETKVAVLNRLGYPVKLGYCQVRADRKTSYESAVQPITLQALVETYNISNMVNAELTIGADKRLTLVTHYDRVGMGQYRFREEILLGYSDELVRSLAYDNFPMQYIINKEFVGDIVPYGGNLYVGLTRDTYKMSNGKPDPRWVSVLTGLESLLDQSYPIELLLLDIETGAEAVLGIRDYASFKEFITSNTGSVKLYATREGRIMISGEGIIPNAQWVAGSPQNFSQVSSSMGGVSVRGTFVTGLLLPPVPTKIRD